MVRISILIATYNRAGLLDECLTHLERQTFEAGDEVIIVNNGSTDHTAAILARRQHPFRVPLRVIDEPRPGKSWALSRGTAVGPVTCSRSPMTTSTSRMTGWTRSVER